MSEDGWMVPFTLFGGPQHGSVVMMPIGTKHLAVTGGMRGSVLYEALSFWPRHLVSAEVNIVDASLLIEEDAQNRIPPVEMREEIRSRLTDYLIAGGASLETITDMTESASKDGMRLFKIRGLRLG